MNPRPSPELKNAVLTGIVEDGAINNGAPFDVSDSRLLERREWSGTVSPDWPYVVQQNPHTVYLYRYRPDPSANFYYKNTSTNWMRYRGPGQLKVAQFANVPAKGSLASSAMADETARRTRSKLISKISREKVNILQNIGEFRQTRSMFLANSLRIANAYRAIRHGDIPGVKRNLAMRKTDRRLERAGAKSLVRNPSSWWLELQYGWLPLLGDVYTGATEFYKRVEQGAFIRETASSAGRTYVFTPDVLASSILRYDRATHRKFVVKSGIRYKVDDSRLANLQDWGVLNPLLLAWELLPYSFVVDWFIPVGDWLSRVGYSVGLVFHDGYESRLIRAASARLYKRNTSTPAAKSGGGFEVFEEVVFKRDQLYNFPTNPPPLSFDSDGLRGKRIGNALALLGVAFGRR